MSCAKFLEPFNFVDKSYISNIYMYKLDLALNNLQLLIYHKTKSNLLG